MDLQTLKQYCNSKTAVSHVVQWGGSDVYKVGGKVFAVALLNKQGEFGVSFKTSELNYHFLANKNHYRPAPYLASRGMKWIQQHNAPSELDEELLYYIDESYRLVSLGLTKKLQKALGLNAAAN
ncbi:MAG: MmcQ/YjbR family DNA-binding protein [Glaciecola sp.]